jgi:hypothetical protein
MAIWRVLPASALLASLAGGAGHALPVLAGSPHPHVVESCRGTALTLTGSGARVTSIQQFKASGGTVIPSALKQAARLPHAQYWVVPAGADVVNTCRGMAVTEVQVGTNERQHSELLAESAIPLWASRQPLVVPALNPLPGKACAPRRATLPIRAPDGRPIAQLSPVPASLSRWIGTTFPPCGVPARVPRGLPPASKRVGIQILSVIQYRGAEGTVAIVTARATAAAARRKLVLGNRVGTLPDGSALWSIHCGRSCPRSDIRWLKSGLIIDMASSAPLDRLKVLAADEVVK